jgi:hypothetical protein
MVKDAIINVSLSPPAHGALRIAISPRTDCDASASARKTQQDVATLFNPVDLITDVLYLYSSKNAMDQG